MITGLVPFQGDYPQAAIYAILNQDPEPVTGLRTGLPLELDRIIGKCLAKSAKERYQHADELLADLLHLKRSSDPTLTGTIQLQPESRGPGNFLWRFRFIWTAVVVLVVAAVFLIPQIIETSVRLQPSPKITPLIVGEAYESLPKWSPVGNMITFEACSDSVWDVWISDLDGANPLNLTANSQYTDRCPTWSPDGQRIAFYSDRPTEATWCTSTPRMRNPTSL